MAEKLINEEFKIWKKTSPMLYDMIYTYSSDSPSLTVQWLKELTPATRQTSDGSSEQVVEAKFILGTHTTGGEQNYLKLYGIDLPPTLQAGANYGEYPISRTKEENVGYGKRQSKLRLLRKWRHPGEINKARIDEKLGLIATQTNAGDILVYDYHDPVSDTARYRLKYHTKEGFGLEWSPFNSGCLLSGNEDTKIALWDIRSHQNERQVTPRRVFATHKGLVNDVSWNGKSSNVFASVSDDGSLQIHDLRSQDTQVALKVEKAHQGQSINAVEFHPDVSSLLATGSTDNFVHCWDLRDLKKPIRRLYGHTGPVLGLKFKNNLLLSTSVDRRVLVWNLNEISKGPFDLKEYEKKKSEYTDPCLSFMHGGHTGRLCEADWHPQLDNVVISCAEDSLVEIWRPLHLEDSFDYEEEEAEAEQKEAAEKAEKEAAEKKAAEKEAEKKKD